MNKTQLLQEVQSLLNQHSKPSEGAKPWSPEKGATHSPPTLQEGFRSPQDHGSTPAVEGDIKTPPTPMTTPDIPGGEPLLRKETLFQDEKTLSSSTKGIRARCQIWLKARLHDGPVPLSEVKKEARQLGYGPKCLRVARKQLNVQPIACLTLPTNNSWGLTGLAPVSWTGS